jgi:hypothetical protein
MWRMVRHKLDSVNDFARKGYNLRITCQGCGHVVDASATTMMQDLIRRRCSRSIYVLERRLKCGECGARKARITATTAEF